MEATRKILEAGATLHVKYAFGLEHVNWFETKDAQKKFLELIGEPAGGSLPPHYMFPCDYNGHFARRNKLLWGLRDR